MTKDMTEGKPLGLILGFAIPMLLGNVFQQFYNMVDTMIVGKFLGVNSLAAVGSTGSVVFLIIGFCLGTCGGFAIPISQSFGAKREDELRRYVANGAILAAILAVIMTVLTVVFCRPILHLMNTPENIFGEAYSYLVIIFLGIPFTVLYNMVSGILRAIGDSKTPLYFLIFSAFLNVVLDLFCILVLKMGVAGAAAATVISQTVAGVLSLIYMYRKFELLRVRRDEWKVETRYMKNLCMMGIPMGLQYSVTAIGSVVLQSSINGLGAVAVAANTAAMRINGLFINPFDALGATMATYAGQNIGAGKPHRIRKGITCANTIGAVYSIVVFAVMIFASDKIALLFVDANETEILSLVKMYMMITSAFYIPLCLVNTMRFLIQGMGYSVVAILSGACEMVARALVGLLLVPVMGYLGACLASPLAWLLADTFLILTYYKVIRKAEQSVSRL